MQMNNAVIVVSGDKRCHRNDIFRIVVEHNYKCRSKSIRS
jgi:hypothetical protein